MTSPARIASFKLWCEHCTPRLRFQEARRVSPLLPPSRPSLGPVVGVDSTTSSWALDVVHRVRRSTVRGAARLRPTLRIPNPRLRSYMPTLRAVSVPSMALVVRTSPGSRAQAARDRRRDSGSAHHSADFCSRRWRQPGPLPALMSTASSKSPVLARWKSPPSAGLIRGWAAHLLRVDGLDACGRTGRW